MVEVVLVLLVEHGGGQLAWTTGGGGSMVEMDWLHMEDSRSWINARTNVTFGGGWTRWSGIRDFKVKIKLV